MPLDKRLQTMKGAGRRKLKAPCNKAEIMKRIGNLYDDIISIENLQLADEKARKGKLQSHGVKRHDLNREQNIVKLHEMLKSKTFRTSECDVFTIF